MQTYEEDITTEKAGVPMMRKTGIKEIMMSQQSCNGVFFFAFGTGRRTPTGRRKVFQGGRGLAVVVAIFRKSRL
jgi:altronate dehydratase